MTNAPTEEAGKHAVAQRAWRYLFEFLMATAGSRERALEKLSLSPNDAKALSSLSLDAALSMSELARLWRTDAPNATWVVNRLEDRRLAVRKLDPQDRRHKLVLLTKRGKQARDALMKAFYEPPLELNALEMSDLEALARIAEKLGSTGEVPRGRSVRSGQRGH